MPPIKQKTTLPTFTSVIERKRKLFQCTGFGDCNMVFTRSEHLARHIRKHTGEKPFKCVVPGCNRMFSRFDNMKQHTQTHQRNTQFDYATTTTSSSSQPSSTSAPRLDTTAVEGTYNCGGLMSPVSLGSPEQSQLSDMWGETASSSSSSTTATSPKHQGQDVSPQALQKESSVPQPRRLPVADLCNNDSSCSSSEIIHLTMDELEALEALAQFRGAPLYHDSLRHLANVASYQYPTYSSYD